MSQLLLATTADQKERFRFSSRITNGDVDLGLSQLFPHTRICSSEIFQKLNDPNKLTIALADFVDEDLFLLANYNMCKEQRVNLIHAVSANDLVFRKSCSGTWEAFLHKGLICLDGKVELFTFPEEIKVDLLVTSDEQIIKQCPDKKLIAPFDEYANRLTHNKAITAKFYKQHGYSAPATAVISRNFSDETIAEALKQAFKSGFTFVDCLMRIYGKFIPIEDLFFFRSSSINLASKYSLVIKPVDGKCGRQVEFIDFFTLDDLQKKIKSYFQRNTETKWVLVQERIESLVLKDKKGNKLDYNFRVLVSKNGIIGIEARVNKFGGAVNKSLGAKIWSVEKLYTTLQSSGNSLSRSKWNAAINKMCNDCLTIARKLNVELLGADICIDKFLQPRHIEINVGRVGGFASLFEIGKNDNEKFSAFHNFIKFLKISRKASTEGEGVARQNSSLEEQRLIPSYVSQWFTFLNNFNGSNMLSIPFDETKRDKILHALNVFREQVEIVDNWWFKLAEADIKNAFGGPLDEDGDKRSFLLENISNVLATISYYVGFLKPQFKAYATRLYFYSKFCNDIGDIYRACKGAVASEPEFIRFFVRALLLESSKNKHDLFLKIFKKAYFDAETCDNEFRYAYHIAEVITKAMQEKTSPLYFNGFLRTVNEYIDIFKENKPINFLVVLDPAYLYLIRAEIAYKYHSIDPSKDLATFLHLRPLKVSEAKAVFSEILSARVLEDLDRLSKRRNPSNILS